MKRLVISLFLMTTAFAQERTITVEKYESPNYPPIARAARVSGSVKLQLLINQDGKVETVKVLSGHPLLQGSAVENITKWRFKCFDCSQPTSFEHPFEYNFVLEGTTCDSQDGYRSFQFPNKVTVTEGARLLHCGDVRMVITRRSWLSRLFRR